MRILVVHRQVPDVIEDLVLAEDGRALDPDETSYVPNELDEHALEQALLLKERHGASVTAVAVGGDEAKDALAVAKAKGADDAVLVRVPPRGHGDNHQLAALLAGLVKEKGFDLLMLGVQAVDDLDGDLGGILAGQLGLPYVGGLAGVEIPAAQGLASVRKEFPGGLLAVLEVTLPAVLGIQASERPPRYVPVSRVLQVKKTLAVTEVAKPLPEVVGVPAVTLAKPAPSTRAQMLEGGPEEVSQAIVRLLQERGLL